MYSAMSIRKFRKKPKKRRLRKCAKKSSKDSLEPYAIDRHPEELLAWVNDRLKSNIRKIEELSNGAAYCQLMHYLYPKLMDMRKVTFYTNNKFDRIRNFLLLEMAFFKRCVIKDIPFALLIEYKYMPNLRFLIWFKDYFDYNKVKPDKEYDPLAERFNHTLGYGPAKEEHLETYISDVNYKAENAYKGKLLCRYVRDKITRDLKREEQRLKIGEHFLNEKYGERNSYLKKLTRVAEICEDYNPKNEFIMKVKAILNGQPVSTKKGSKKII
ncbi:microtubule-associated protein RP/EB family member 1-like [Teleopsis dalmanni]|uniref:microtubule-associated protein RP/EB family member 1-like n=1 Tax=Teleopsis dalmanni TaxID=139649 RepID=UPI0018CD0E88|nr:microtubule-associated protein RP/EB family member 1-like [Teleopsis dalmanni]